MQQRQQQQQMNSNPNARTFVSYNVYKGKAAMSVKPVNPVINTMSNGNKLLTKDGGLLIEIAPMSGGIGVYLSLPVLYLFPLLYPYLCV